MPEESTSKRWVVLIQKKPRGPLSEAEVQALFIKGLVRANDLAFEISTEGKALSDWKMLWQFAEFDRRAKAAAEAAKKGLPPPTHPMRDRRQPPSPEAIQQKVNEQIPTELIDISPEELIPRPRSQKEKPSVMEFADLPSEDQGSGVGRPSRFAYAAVVLAILGVVFSFKWTGSKKSGPVRLEDTRLPAMDEMEPAPRGSSSSPPPTVRSRTLPTNLGGAPREPEAPSTYSIPAARNEPQTPNDREGDRDRGSIPYDADRDQAWDEETYDEDSPKARRRAKTKAKDPEDDVEAGEDRGVAGGDDAGGSSDNAPDED